MQAAQTRPGQSVGFWLWKVCHEYQRLMEAALHKEGLTHLQFVLLAATDWLGKEHFEVTQRQVAEFTEIGVAQISHLVKAVKGKGWLRQMPALQDPRARALSLTPSGSEVLARVLPQMSALERQLFPEDGERQQLTDQLRAVLLRWTGRLPVS
jgi:DNA-binding MarR family transcriptional regulator